MIPTATLTSRSTSNGRLVIAFLVVVVVVVVCVLPFFPLVHFLVSFFIIIIVRANPVVIDWLDGESLVVVRILIFILASKK